MFVGEAPGRLGADRTGVPFWGDESGRRLDNLITAAGWHREELFLTNAILCNPRDVRGCNRPPLAAELNNCRTWLMQQIDLIDPVLVVALGGTALKSLHRIESHQLQVADAGRLPVPWNGRWLAAAYHPGARAAIHRSTDRQLEDFRRFGHWHRSNAESGEHR